MTTPNKVWTAVPPGIVKWNSSFGSLLFRIMQAMTVRDVTMIMKNTSTTTRKVKSNGTSSMVATATTISPT